MTYTETFRTLIEEGQFTNQILGSGVTLLGKANYAEKGYYFTSFTALSTGLERIGKLCLILDFYIENKGQFPSEKELKYEIGHDLEKLYKKSIELISKHKIEHSNLNKIESKICQKVLSILSKFAKGDRYSNLNSLVNSNYQSDPIFEWNEFIDKEIYELRVSNRKKQKIELNAKIVGKLLNPISHVSHFSESRKEINQAEQASFLTGVYESVSKYRQLYVLQIIRYWVVILEKLQYKAMELGKEEIPFFSEIFAIFYNNDNYFLTRKTYDSWR